MYIDQMDITGFGVYSGLLLNLEPGLNIFLGPNEAGKSTCHEFVRFMLYGRPTGSGSRNAPRYEPLQGGEHGGALELVTQAGQSLRLTRKGKTPQKFSLVNEDMEELGPEMLGHILGQAGPDIYNTVFAFSIKELYDLNALAPEKVPDVLCGINFGLGALSVAAVLKDLEQRQGKLYKPAGSNPVLNSLFAELRRVEEQLAPLRRNLDEYAVLSAQLAGLDAENALLRAEHDQLRAEYEKFKLAQQIFPHWQERGRLEKLLRELPAADEAVFAADDLARLELIEQRGRDQHAQAARVQAQIDELDAKIAHTPLNPVLLEVDDLLAKITGQRGQYSESRDLIPQRQTQLGELKARIEALLASLDQHWTRGQAMSFNFSKKAWLENLLTDLKHSERDADLAEQEQARLLREAEDLAAPESLADLPAVDTLRANLRDLRELRHEQRRLGYDAQVEELSSLGRHRTRQYGMLAFGVYFGVIAAVAANIWTVLGLGLGLGLGAGLALLALFAGLALVLPKATDQGRLALQERLNGIQAQINAAGAALGLNDAEDENFTAIEERINRLARVEQLKDRAATEKAKAETSGNAFALLRVKLRDFLVALGINPDCGAAEVRAIMDRMQDLQPLLAQETALKHEIEHLEKRLDDFSNDLGYLLARVAIAWEFDARGAPDPLATLAKVEATVRAARDASLAREHLQQQRGGLKSEQARQTEAARLLDAELEGMLRSRGVATPEEFRQAFALWRESQDLKGRFEQVHKEILAAAGEKQDGVLHLLSYISAEKLAHQVANLAGHLEEQNRLEAERQQRQGKLTQQRDALLDEARFEDLRFKEEALKQEIAENARTWTIIALARQAVSEAKTFFEQNRQPAVMRAASGWFKTITLGEYAGISPDSEPGALSVLTAKKEPRRVDQLSRGTREQLFLAMRLALIEDRAREAETLPVLMDDILVNFDPERSYAAADAVLKLARTHQVLFFTCHPHTARVFEELGREAERPVKTFGLDSGRLRP